VFEPLLARLAIWVKRRTARSRTSGENLLGLAMTPSSQGLEPPGISARFTPRRSIQLVAGARNHRNRLASPSRWTSS